MQIALIVTGLLLIYQFLSTNFGYFPAITIGISDNNLYLLTISSVANAYSLIIGVVALLIGVLSLKGIITVSTKQDTKSKNSDDTLNLGYVFIFSLVVLLLSIL